MELFLLFLFSFSSVIIVFFIYLGYFNPVKFEIKDTPSLEMAVVSFVGAYKDATSKQLEVLKVLAEAGLDVSATVAIYFDDAKKMEDEVCRCLVGVVIKDVKAFSDLNLDMQLLALPIVKSYFTSFSYKSGLSIMLAIMKIYPAIKKRHKRHNAVLYESIEVYDFTNKVLNYYFPKESIASLWKLS